MFLKNDTGWTTPTLMDILPVNSGSMKLLLDKDLLLNWQP